jgi:flagellar basal-body rod protein FlgF
VSAQPRGTDIPQSTAVLSVTPQTLEGSNVNSMEVLIRLMEQSRSFEQAINIIKQTKDADESGATMMKPT